MRSHGLLTALAVMLAGVSFGANSFRVTPYVQHPKPDAMTVMWLAQEAGDASITYWKVGSSETTTLSAVRRDDLSGDISGIRFKMDDALEYCRAPELGYDMDPNGGNDKERGGGWNLPATIPWQYRVRLTGLEADTAYGYRVQLTGGASYENTFRTSPDPAKWRGFKFIYYSDSETEPGDNDPGGRTDDWTIPAGSPRKDTVYYASQTRAYASNICAAVDFGTDLIVMAGDLAQRGSRQCDWDEFWRHNAGPLNDPAGSIPILASPGNHDYWSYADNSVIGPRKYLSYFEYEQNDAEGMGDDQRERFHRVDYGPVTFIFLDGNNGDDSDKSKDTNHSISTAGGCRAPDFNPGSPQYKWLERQLADAQRKSAFTFIVTHQCPFSVGYHGQDTNHDTLSGRPLRVWLPILHKYGVDGWFAGHDEMMERSVSEGTETLPDGTEVPHSLNVWDMGIAGDGLRGNLLADNPYQRYRASVDSPEVFENGVHVEGGVHYGQLQVTVDQTEDGRWRATFDPIYLFFSKDTSGNLVYGGVRHYADKVVRISNRCKGAPPVPTPVTEMRVDYSAYAPAKMPQGLVTTFWNGPLSRGFSWQTDTSVTETKLWLLKGEYDQDDGNTFVGSGRLVTGDYTDNTSVSLRCHRLHVTGLENDCTYSYRLGGNGHYVYGRFRTQSAPDSVTAVYFSDTQTKDAKLLYKIENTIAAAARRVGGADKVNLLISGGDIFNQSTMANVNHVTGRAYAGSWEWAWGLTADLITPYFPDLPWFTVPGNHDKAYYGKLTSVDYYSTGMTYSGCSSVDVGNVHFALLPYLDSYSGRSAEYAKAFAWLDADLKASSALWKVVCVHWGPYSTGDHGGVKAGYSEGVVDYVKALAPLLSSNHVDLVLQAHDHVFTKTVPYRWDTAGYTSATDDETVLNLTPETAMIGGDAYDVNPRGTYYVCTGCAGHRAAEEPTCPTIDGEHSFTKRDPRIVVGKISVRSRFRNIGDYASADFHEIDAKGFQMYGVLKVDGDRLAYDFYVAEEDGTSTLVDTLRVCKPGKSSSDGFSVMLR